MAADDIGKGFPAIGRILPPFPPCRLSGYGGREKRPKSLSVRDGCLI